MGIQDRAAFWNALGGRRTGWQSVGAHLHPHKLGPDLIPVSELLRQCRPASELQAGEKTARTCLRS